MLGRFEQRLNPAAEPIAQDHRQLAGAGPYDRQQLLVKNGLPSDRANTSSNQVGRWGGSEDTDQLRSHLDLIKPGQFHALHRVAAVQLGDVGAQRLLAGSSLG